MTSKQPNQEPLKGYNVLNTTHLNTNDKKATVFMNNVLVAAIDHNSEEYKTLFTQSKFVKYVGKFGETMNKPIITQPS